MARPWLEIALAFLLYLAATWVVFNRQSLARVLDAPTSLGRRMRRLRRPAEQSAGKPIEQVVADVRRLGPLVHHPPRGASRAKQEAWRHAYDHALSDAARAVEVDHLLGVLPPGQGLDAERARLEGRLWLAGLRLDEPA